MSKRANASATTSLQQDVELLNRWVDEVCGLNKLVLKKLAGKHKGPIPRPAETSIARAILDRDDEAAVIAARAYVHQAAGGSAIHHFQEGWEIWKGLAKSVTALEPERELAQTTQATRN